MDFDGFLGTLGPSGGLIPSVTELNVKICLNYTQIVVIPTLHMGPSKISESVVEG